MKNPVWQKIMVGTDGSEYSLKAARAAAMVALSQDAELLIVTAIGYLTPFAHAATDSLPNSVIDQAKKAVEDAKKIAKSMGVKKMKTEILQADPRRYPYGANYVEPAEKMLVQYAQDNNVDLLVVGTHGRTGIRRMLLGSVSQYVIAHAPCAVLVCRAKVLEETLLKEK